MGDDDGGASGQAGEVTLQPSDINDIEMVGWLIEQEDIGLEQHGTGESQLHLPATRETSNAISLALIVEADRGEGRDNFSLVSEHTLVTQDEVKDGGLSLGAVDVVLNVEGSDHIRGWETLDLTVVQYGQR